ncbi:macrolide resistance MFS transporter Mrx(A) [Phytohabitans flavus]|uniref:MFS transporter n=1 Tax=Phytohabitans flavus TaxID=1076124 RepID=A0A6F8Y5W3_9ACTN|nr:MFS transporter [Phytohabitans flavus]
MKRGFAGLLAAEGVSFIGTRMSFVALPWFVLVTSGSAARTGIVAFAEMLPYVLVCAFGGPLLDRLGHRRVSVLGDLGSAVAVAAIPLLHHGPGLSYGGLVAIVTLLGTLRGFGDSAKRVLLPRTIATAGINVTRATSLHDGLFRLSTLLGPPAAGLLVTAFDATVVLLIDAASFGVAAVLIAVLVPGAEAERRHEPYLRALRAGWQFIGRDRLLLGLAVMIFVTNLIDQSYSAVLAPVWARDVAGSATALGLLFGLFGVGAVAGSLVFAVVAPRLPRYGTFVIGMLIGGAPRFVALALGGDTWVVYAVVLLAGFSIAGVNPVLSAMQYERVPEAMRARVLGITLAIAWGGIPLGALLGGWSVEWLGLTVSLLLFGALYLAVTLAPLALPEWREMDRSAGQPHEDQQQDERGSGDGEDDEQVPAAGVRSGRGGDGLGG